VNRETRLLMVKEAGLISRATARGELDFLDDEAGEEKKNSKEAMIDAVNGGIIAQAGQGDVKSALLYFKLLNDPNLTMEEVLEKFHEEQEKMAQEAAAAASNAQGGQVTPQAGQAGVAAESLARGGIPGNAEGLPAGAALPGQPPILSPDAPRQVL